MSKESRNLPNRQFSFKTNLNTVTGRNVAFVLKATGYNHIEDVNTKEVKERVKFCAGSEENTWRDDFIKETMCWF